MIFPTNEKVAEAEVRIKELQVKLAKKDFESAEIYETMEYHKAAIKYYGIVAEVYHDSEYAPTALYRRINLLIFKDRVPEALSDITVFLSRYADNEYAEELKEMQATLK